MCFTYFIWGSNNMNEVGKYFVKVGKKGQIVIPAEARRKLGIKDRVYLIVYDNKIELIPLRDLEELVGVHREAMLEIAREVPLDRRREVRIEKT